MLWRLNARSRFRAMAEAPMSLGSISLSKISFSQQVDQEIQSSKCLIFISFDIIKLNFYWSKSQYDDGQTRKNIHTI